MITINLLPENKRTRVANAEKEAVLFLLMLILVLLGLSTTQGWMSHRVKTLRTATQEKDAEKRRLLKKIGKIKKLEEKTKEAEQYIKAIKDIRTKQGRPVLFLDELVEDLPRDQIWFESLNLEQKGRIDLHGVALDNQVFASYVKKIRGSKVISDVILQQTSRKRISEYNLVAFRCRIIAGFSEKTKGNDG